MEGGRDEYMRDKRKRKEVRKRGKEEKTGKEGGKRREQGFGFRPVLISAFWPSVDIGFLAE